MSYIWSISWEIILMRTDVAKNRRKQIVSDRYQNNNINRHALIHEMRQSKDNKIYQHYVPIRIIWFVIKHKELNR